jgi:hypothetical protein
MDTLKNRRVDNMTLVEKFIGECNIDRLRNEAMTSLNISIMNDYTDDFNEYYVAYVGDVVSGSYGQYQAKAVCEYFGLDYNDDDDDIWYEIERIADKIAEKLTELCVLRGQFYFGHLEADGSYGLFYTEEMESESDDNY